MVYGVGVIGAGPGVAALHVPTLQRLAAQFRIVHVADAGSGRSAELAARLGAASSAGVDGLLADDRVEVVAVCSPPEQHAAHVLAAVAAGARAVMCEKPLATTIDDAERVIDACRAAGTVLLVGTNHLYDDAWGRTKHHLLAAGAAVRTVSLTMSLAPNGRYHTAVTDDPPLLPHRGGAPDLTDPRVAAAVVRQLVVGLAVHDLPLLRDLAPAPVEVVYARPLAPMTPTP